MGTQLPSLKQGGEPPPQKKIRPIFIVAKRLDASRCHLVRGKGLGICDIVFDVDPATLRKSAHPPSAICGPCLLWPNGWMDEDAAWYGSRPRPRPHCTRRGPSSREKGTAAPPLFGPCLLWPRSPISATAQLLYSNNVIDMHHLTSQFTQYAVRRVVPQ